MSLTSKILLIALSVLIIIYINYRAFRSKNKNKEQDNSNDQEQPLKNIDDKSNETRTTGIVIKGRTIKVEVKDERGLSEDQRKELGSIIGDIIIKTKKFEKTPQTKDDQTSKPKSKSDNEPLTDQEVLSFKDL